MVRNRRFPPYPELLYIEVIPGNFPKCIHEWVMPVLGNKDNARICRICKQKETPRTDYDFQLGFTKYKPDSHQWKSYPQRMLK